MVGEGRDTQAPATHWRGQGRGRLLGPLMQTLLFWGPHGRATTGEAAQALPPLLERWPLHQGGPLTTTLDNIWRRFWLLNLGEGMLLGSSGWGPGVLPAAPQQRITGPKERSGRG